MAAFSELYIFLQVFNTLCNCDNFLIFFCYVALSARINLEQTDFAASFQF